MKRPKRGVPEGLWLRCPGCEQPVFRKEAERRLNVCPYCEYHYYISARERIIQVLDEGTFEEWDALSLPLRFTFVERLNHWMTATSFILLGLTGLNYVFGKRLLFPLMGPDAFAVWSQWAKYIHNFVSWPFMIGIVLMILFWIKDKALTDTDSLPPPDIIATEIADDLEAALVQFTKIAARLPKTGV